MKLLLCSALITGLSLELMAQSSTTNSPATPTPAKLASTVFAWDKMQSSTTATGARRAVFDAPTATLDKVHCHITTLNPGQNSGAPRRHLQEEIIIVREGMIEATFDGKSQTAGPGSVIFFAANAVTRLRNVGEVPATYTVIYYFTPLTPKE